MNNKTHLFFDMDMTITPSREPLLKDMFELLTSLSQDITIVSGSTIEQIFFQTNVLPAYRLGVNGNHAVDIAGNEIWKNPGLTEEHKLEIHGHIKQIISVIDHELNDEWEPVHDRDAQITFSPLGNIAPVELKKAYDPDRSKRENWLKRFPFESNELIVKIGGSTSLDYIHKDKHKGANVQKMIDHMKWNKEDCIYFGDGLYPGGNDEAVIGVIDTEPVSNHLDTYKKLKQMFSHK